MGIFNRSKKTYIISALQSVQSDRHGKNMGYDSKRGAPNKHLIAGLEKYCDVNSAELILLTMDGMDRTETDYHPFFYNYNVLRPEDRNIKLNKNCIITDDTVPPQNMDPSTSRDRLVQQGQTRIYAHSKQRFRPVASGNISLPKLLITTGACTYPNYDRRNHKGDMAWREHEYGAVVVEVIDDIYFNVRHIGSQINGKFIDLAHKYDGNKISRKKVGVEALVLGDLHLGDHDPKSMQASYEMIRHFNPKRLFLHDLFNGHSVNPHERNNLLEKVKNFNAGRVSIEDELKMSYNELVKLSKMMKGGEVNVVFSNHDFFLERYLQSGILFNEPWNVDLALKLSRDVIAGKNPVEEGIKLMGKLPSNVNFLKLRDDYKVWGWQLASHGHKGTSGGRGSVKSREEGHGKSISGHTHAPEKLRNTIIVGTNSKLDLPYTDGGNTKWMAANAVLYEGGSVQLLPIINGKWKMKRR